MTKGRGLGLWLISLEVEILATERSPAGTQEEPLNKLREDPVGHLVQRVPNTGTAKGTWWVIVVESGISFLMPEIWHEVMEQGAQTCCNSAMHRVSHGVKEGLGRGGRR